jgi:hypothetical protein
VRQIANCLETLLPFIQERLLNELSLVLSGGPFVEPAAAMAAPSTIAGSSALSTLRLSSSAGCVARELPSRC